MSFRDLIVRNFMSRAKKGLGIVKGLDKFQYADVLINSWIAFEGFSCEKYQLDGVKERINEFSNDFADDYRTNYDKLPDVLRDNLVELSKKTVADMRPSHLTDKPKKIRDLKELSEVMEVIYQVRNNLFHGGKNPADIPDDHEKIRLSATVFYYILERYLS